MNKEVKKGWGKEIIFASNELYAGKILYFEKAGSKMSMHFHKSKDETWKVLTGSFNLYIIETETAEIKKSVLEKDSVWRNPPLLPHQLEALEDNSTIIEVSTADCSADNYRVFPGDSQK